MKLTHCWLLTAIVTVASYASWFAWVNVGPRLPAFDGPPPAPPRETERMPIQIVKKQPPTNASPGKSARAQAPTAPSVLVTPMPGAAAAQDGTLGAGLKQLDVLFDTSLEDDLVMQLLDRDECSIVALKVEGDSIVEAFLPNRVGKLEVVNGTQAMNAFREDHPCDRCLWVRFRGQNPLVGRQARRALEAAGRRPDEFNVYVVLGRLISGRVNRCLEKAALNQGMSPTEIVAATIALAPQDRRLDPRILELRTRAAEPHERGGRRQPGGAAFADESEKTKRESRARPWD